MHALVGVPSTASIADLVRLAKGASSHLANHVLFPDTGFRWQGSYAAFSVSRSDVDRVERYVRTQAAHHAEGALDADHEL